MSHGSPDNRRSGRKRAYTATELLIKEVAALFAPPPSMTLDEWADTHRKLSPGESNEPGQWYTHRVPATREIMRAYSDAKDQVLWIIDGDARAPRAVPWTRRNGLLCWMSSAQQAKTNIFLNVIGYHMHLDPCSLIVGQPSEDLMKKFSEKKLTPMLQDCPCLDGLVDDNKAKGGQNTVQSKSFPGGNLYMINTSSANQMRMISGKVILCDELDGWMQKITGGDPFLQIQDRAIGFEKSKKVFCASTPLREETSRIEPMFKGGTQERWCYACPSCGAWQVVEFDDRLDWQTLTYACDQCGCTHREYEWKKDGRWIAGNPEAEYRSFHTNGMSSPLQSWGEIVRKCRVAQDDLKKGNPETYETFVNTTLGHSYQERGETIEASAFERNRHHYACDVPAGVLALTVQADTQDNRVEVEVRGWGRGFETWGIQYVTIPGTMDQPAVREQLDAIMQRVWTRPDGVMLSIARYVQDSGGHYTDEVYAFTRKRAPLAYAVHGSSTYTDPLVGRVSEVGRDGEKTPLFTLGVNVGKTGVFNRLKIVEHEGPGFHHWPREATFSDGITPRGYDAEYFQQLTNEHRVKRYSHGFLHHVWMPKRKGLPVEAWDILIYGHAAILMLGGEQYLQALAAQDDARALQQAAPAGRAGGRRVLSPGVRM